MGFWLYVLWYSCGEAFFAQEDQPHQVSSLFLPTRIVGRVAIGATGFWVLTLPTVGRSAVRLPGRVRYRPCSHGKRIDHFRFASNTVCNFTMLWQPRGQEKCYRYHSIHLWNSFMGGCRGEE
jgi:hypothetical protein